MRKRLDIGNMTYLFCYIQLVLPSRTYEPANSHPETRPTRNSKVLQKKAGVVDTLDLVTEWAKELSSLCSFLRDLRVRLLVAVGIPERPAGEGSRI